MRDVPVRVRWFVWGTVLFGSALLAMTLWHAEWAWLHVMALAMAVGLSFMRVDLRRYDSKHKVLINLDIAITFFMMAMFGPAWAMLTLVFSTLVTGVTARTQAYKIAFNIGTLMISSWISAELVYRAHLPFPWGLVLAATGYFLVNTTCITLVISMLGGRNPLTVWRESYAWLAAQHLTLAVAGFALGKLVASVGWWALLGALPLPMLHYTLWLNARANERHIQQQEALSSELITTLAAVVDARDAYTFGHSTFVARYSEAIAEQMGYTREQLARLYRSALLHDIGKVGIPESILFKPGRLTAEEYEIMKQHSLIGYQIIRQIRSLREAAQVALHHHERWNGSGYPHGLAGEKVDLDSRIVGVADSLETMLSDRPYRSGISLDEALAEIDRCCGTLFDPAVVAALHKVVEVKGRAFFVNSAKVVQRNHSTLWPWSPEEITKTVATAWNQA
ncbi:MAG: HD-GYP domain-containing protein [Bacillota bacterium]